MLRQTGSLLPGEHRWRPPLRWLPFLAGSAAVAASGLAGGLPLSLGSLAWAGLLWILWLMGKRLWIQAAVFALLLSPIGWESWVAQPRAERLLRSLPPSAYVRVGGVVRDWDSSPDGLRHRLGRATVESGGLAFRLAELDVEEPRGFPDRGVRRRMIRIGGRLVEARRTAQGVSMRLEQVSRHLEAEPIRKGGGEWLRAALADRAGYYLPPRTLAVYLPIVLGVRERSSPESREVTAAFNRVGVAHLFAISGLHVGLVFLFLLGLARLVAGFWVRRQGWVHLRTASRAGVLLLLWTYIALIGFPAPAVRAAAMGSLLVWSQLWGTRPSPAYVLVLAAALMLGWDPSLLHDLSFQLSFLAFACLAAAASLWSLRPPPEERGSLASRLLSGAALNLLITFAITLGLWPLVSSVFERVSLLVFAGNLLLVPLMGVAILPAGLAAFAASLIALGSPPETALERLTFGVLDPLLSGWTAVVEALDRAGRFLVFDFKVEWSHRGWYIYYAGVTLAFLLARAVVQKAVKRDSQA